MNADVLFLSLEDVLYLHARGIELYGGEPGVRDLGLVESATMMAQQTFEGRLLHSSIAEMAAAYLFHLARNHGFVDGNKRVALRAAHVFLLRNGFDLDLTADEAADLTEKAAQGLLSKDGVRASLEARLVRTE